MYTPLTPLRSVGGGEYVSQKERCSVGEHEPEDIVYFQGAAYPYKNEPISLPVCRHCRCLYAEKP